MLNYLEKFKQLPQAVRDNISSPASMSAIANIEKKYNISLATVIMRVIVKDISLVDLPKFFVFEFDMDGRQAEKLVEELKENVLVAVGDYLGVFTEEPEMIISKGKMIDNTDKKLDNWMQDRKSEAAVRGSSFFFSAEDEEEVKSLTKKLEDFNVQEKKPEEKQANYDYIIDEVIKKINISFSSSDLRNRFSNIMTSYLRGIRNKIDTKQAMMRKADAGGLGVNEIYADNIILFTDKIKTEKPAQQAASAPTKHQAPNAETAKNNFANALAGLPPVAEKKPDIAAGNARDIDYDYKHMPSLKDKQTAEASADAKKAQSEKAETEINTDDEKAQSEKADAGSEAELKMPSITIDKPAPAAEPTAAVNIKVNNQAATEAVLREIAPSAPVLRQRGENGKIKIEDVKHVPKLIGPLDELIELDLINFRRLGADPLERTQKIKDKIVFLEEESYAQRLAGIKAWRQSPVNILYLDIGRESISAHQGIDAIISARREKGADYLSEEEFSAIMELNKSLRY